MRSSKKPSNSNRVSFLAALLLGAGLLFGLSAAPVARAASLDTTLQQYGSGINLAKPKIEIPIPNLTLTDAIAANDTITIPWIGQYISGVYNFLLSIVGVLAAVMMMIGGFQYLTAGGDKGRVDAGKKRITNALTGMVLALGSYIVLYVISPDLVQFKALRLAQVQTDQDFFDAFNNTTAATSQSPDPASASPNAVAGSHTPTNKDCPLSGVDTSLSGVPSFFSAISTNAGNVVTATDLRGKIVQIADIAIACKLHLGNCGRTAGTFTALAGAGQQKADCLAKMSSDTCTDNRGREVHSITQSERLQIYASRCDTEGSEKWPKCTDPGPWKTFPPGLKGAKKAGYGSIADYCAARGCMCVRSDCVQGTGQTDWAAAKKTRNAVRDMLLAEAAAGKLPGWPDKWADDLKPGDWVVIFNGNFDLVGAHSVIFEGWAPGGKMQVAQGDATYGVHGGTWCVKSECKDNMYPILYTFSPD